MAEELGGEHAQSDVGAKRERSSIVFPYGDLDDAVFVVKTIYSKGGLQCTTDQLAAWMGHESVVSGTFRLRLSTTRIFGLIETTQQHVVLTDRGRRVINPSAEPQARVEAFLDVPLYREIFSCYRGHLLPGDAALENEMARLGVSRKQVSRARQAFQRSAEQAGFFSHGRRDRLVLPASATNGDFQESERKATPDDSRRSEQRVESTNPQGSGMHPFIQGLFQSLPIPGAQWAEDEREVWLETAKNIFKLIYK